MNRLHLLTTVTLALASATLLTLGCEHTDDQNVATPAPGSVPQPMGATNPQSREVDASIVDRLANARCDREQACNNVGDGRKYSSRRTCSEQLHGGISNDLNSYQCPGGIDGTAVQQCLTAIGNEECGAHPVEAITRMDKCRSGAMCLK
jgi:hypothetical protein